MSNEKTDEFLSWRGRLDQPDALPEQGLDNHEASWQRLAERLREKPRRLTGYWVAAACLLLALIPAIRFLHHRSPATALRLPAPVMRHTSVRQEALVEKVAARPLPVAHPVSARSRVLDPRIKVFKMNTFPPLNVPPTPHPSPRPAADSITGPTAPPAITAAAITAPDIKPATDSHQLMALLPAPKKQLKVVYYNEISNPSGPSPSTAARIPAFLKFSMGRSGSPITAGDQETQPNNDPVLTIKLIPKNN
jgi:hypothetical protein